MTSPTPGTGPDDARHLPDLRADLLDADYTLDGVRALLGPVAADALDREQALPARLATAGGLAGGGGGGGGAGDGDGGGAAAAAQLLRLFQLGEVATRRDLDAALPRLGTAGAERLGLVRTRGEADRDEVRAVVDLSPYAAVDAAGQVDWWIASDPGEIARRGALPEDFVLGVGGASRTLAQITVRGPVGSVLDVGTGCGIQALHASRHAGRVVATDIDARALAFTRFNAALAGVELDVRAGSMLDPVAGETFDLVVSNPPFVITSRDAAGSTGGVGEFTYRDGGQVGDDVVRSLVTSVGSVLAPGGVAQMLGNWEHRRGEDWAERVGGWLAESGLDGWVVQREVQDPAEYAELWLRDGGLTPDRDRARFEAAYAAWLADLASRDVEGIGFGFVTLRRPAGAGAEVSPWRRVEEITGTVAQPLGATIAGVLGAVDLVRDLTGEALLARRWVVAGDVTDERYFTPGEASPRVMILRAGGGFSRTVRTETGLAAFVGACDGELTGGQIVAALSALLEVDATALAAELEPQLRGLITDGMLLPAV
ncbi:SAM-dependent methyltransferase [Serinibacter arcticus]|uniref:SAM-dependent methyltransferase n=1 Tax=Serinibacter arcticus TaxID=1655435 RepID=A0A2U1ZUR4_9MICO|nr:methyltransferase [Serinibacter arcticus]PWD50690.1 SAM-dependent methyltransferase [Serinibacter arcticus]